jgi:curli biogenesis system outer membrane secretion channel CsgG
MTRNAGLVSLVIVTLFGLAGCASAPPIPTASNVAAEAVGAVAACPGPKPRVAVLDFDAEMPNKAQLEEAKMDVSRGVAEALMTELNKNGCYKILERKKIDQIVSEIKLGQSEYFDKSTTVKKGKLMGAEFLFAGAVTEFDPAIGGASLSARVPGIGGIEASVTYAYVGLQIRMLNAETGEVVKSVRADGRIANVAAGGSFAWSGMQIGGSAFAKTPLGDAFKQALGAGVKQMMDLMGAPAAAAPAAK